MAQKVLWKPLWFYIRAILALNGLRTTTEKTFWKQKKKDSINWIRKLIAVFVVYEAFKVFSLHFLNDNVLEFIFKTHLNYSENNPCFNFKTSEFMFKTQWKYSGNDRWFIFIILKPCGPLNYCKVKFISGLYFRRGLVKLPITTFANINAT